MEKILFNRLVLVKNKFESYIIEKYDQSKKELECYVVYGSIEDIKEELEVIIENYKSKDVYLIRFDIENNILTMYFNDDGDEIEVRLLQGRFN